VPPTSVVLPTPSGSAIQITFQGKFFANATLPSVVEEIPSAVKGTNAGAFHGPEGNSNLNKFWSYLKNSFNKYFKVSSNRDVVVQNIRGVRKAIASNTAATAIKKIATTESKITSKEIASFFPHNDGFLFSPKSEFLMPGTIIDRVGIESGRYFSPTKTPIPMRALPVGTETESSNTYRVLKPFEVQSGIIAPAFNQPGLGTQYKSPLPVIILLKRGIIKKVQE